eukprot:1396088-Pyramimonas_sp.AAC.1
MATAHDAGAPRAVDRFLGPLPESREAANPEILASQFCRARHCLVSSGPRTLAGRPGPRSDAARWVHPTKASIHHHRAKPGPSWGPE